jgi:hypothetical protein
MEQITLIFTKREWNPGSYAIRWSIPKSRFQVAAASHCLIKDGDYYIEAAMGHGVRRTLPEVALKGLTVVKEITFYVPNAEAGLAFARSQIGKPYDYKGAIGLSLAPDRDWTEADMWFCFELAAATLKYAGREDFSDDAGHITGTLLMAIKPNRVLATQTFTKELECLTKT